MKYRDSNLGPGGWLGRHLLAPLAVILLAAFAASAPADELIENGGFEQPDLMDTSLFPSGTRAHDQGWTSFFGTNWVPGFPPCTVECNSGITIPGWIVLWADDLSQAGRVEIQNNYLADWVNPILPPGEWPIAYAKSGTQKAEMDSHDRRDPVTDAVIENDNIALGQIVETCPGEPYVVRYWWRSRTTLVDDNDVLVSVGSTVNRQHSMNSSWQEEVINFVATDYLTSIAFISTGAGTTYGMSLDDVSFVGKPGGSLAACDQVYECEYEDYNGDGVHDDLDHHMIGGDPTCKCEQSPFLCPWPKDGSKLETLTLLYNGRDDTFHSQPADKVKITPTTVGTFPVDAVIKVKDGPTFNLQIGELFTVDIKKSSTVFEIYDASTNVLVQTVEFHTSCSQPLNRYDEFGGLTAWDGTLLP